MQAESARSCGTCTACCDGWLRIEVRGHQVRPGKPCPFRIQHGCELMRGRHAAAILHRMDVRETTAGGVEEYISIAAALGSDRARRGIFADFQQQASRLSRS